MNIKNAYSIKDEDLKSSMCCDKAIVPSVNAAMGNT